MRLHELSGVLRCDTDIPPAERELERKASENQIEIGMVTTMVDGMLKKSLGVIRPTTQLPKADADHEDTKEVETVEAEMPENAEVPNAAV